MNKTILSYCLYVALLSHNAFSKEVFTVDNIKEYLTKDNPYIYGAIAQQYIDVARIKTTQGNFDTRINAYYDNKDYPLSTGEFSDVTLTTPTENGTEFILGYRKTRGIQEYNNIKTGEEGEFRVGVNVPVFSVLHDINERKYKLDSTKINATESTYNSQNNLRNIYSHIVVLYYKLLYSFELITLEQELLKKAERRNHFIIQRVKSGDLPKVALLESSQQIINRQQRVLNAQNNYTQSLQIFLKYLNVPQNKFDFRYALPSLKFLKKEKNTFENVISQAIDTRPDIKALELKSNQLDLDSTYNKLLKYPKLNFFAYGVHDRLDGDGVKVGLQFEIPLQRREYEGKKVEIQKSVTQLKHEKNRLIIDLKTNLHNLLYSLDIANKDIDLANQETKIVESLEEVENKKYEVGSSDLFQVNQRESIALEVKKKQLEYYLKALIIQQKIKQEMGEFITL